MARYAEVAVDAPSGYNHTFSYSIPKSLIINIGCIVVVPFGKRTVQGVVFSLVDNPQVAQTREILSVVDPNVILPDIQLELARWISQYYMSSLFEAAALMLPPGLRKRYKVYLSLGSCVDQLQDDLLTPLEQKILKYVCNKGIVDQERVIKLLGPKVKHNVDGLVSKQILERVSSLTSKTVNPKYVSYLNLDKKAKPFVMNWLSEMPHKAPRQTALLKHLLSDVNQLLLSDARKMYGYSAVAVLLNKGWVEKSDILVDRDPLTGRNFPPSPDVTLTPPQNEVALEISDSMLDESNDPKVFLLHGVTGSGKTEIYIRAVERCLCLGKKVIVLVPEIALTHQTVERFAARFPGEVAVQHSGLSLGERFDQWWKIKQGDVSIVIGSRSAIFAPQLNLGLIIIDEEHEWTFKQHDISPRYHARDVALNLANLSDAVVVMGSGSPDVVSYFKGVNKEYRLLTLTDRVLDTKVPFPRHLKQLGTQRDKFHVMKDDHRKFPYSVPIKYVTTVDVVDMRKELKEGNRSIFSRSLLVAMEECLKSNDQMILFLNRRGSKSYLQCRNCGMNQRCRRCDMSLTYHKEINKLVCHYCRLQRRTPDKCPRCLSFRLSYYGIGTQTVVDEVSRLFPGVSILRWDKDSAKTHRTYEEFLKRFRSREAQVMVGTQMIAKGLHFPAVSLVGVVSADIGLNIPDYRSGERSFQLICQVAGRAGRGESLGRVIVQTYQPDNYAVKTASAQDYQQFYSQEMDYRSKLINPPFSKLIRLIYSHINLASSERESLRMATVVREKRDDWGYTDIDILGPTPAYPARLRGSYRWHLILKGPDPRMLLDKITIPPGWVVDVDPVSLT